MTAIDGLSNDVKRVTTPADLAHVDQHDGREHLLEEHLRDVGTLAAQFAQAWESASVAGLVGKWHDLGKYRQAFQDMIRGADGEDAHVESLTRTRVDHSSPGALYARDALRRSGIDALSIPIQLAISGHHTGLQDLSYWREERLPRTSPLLSELPLDRIPAAILNTESLSAPEFLMEVPEDTSPAEARRVLSRRLEFWTRMIFSALVDADFLDTEVFFSQERAALRGDFPQLQTLANRLKDYLDALSDAVPNTDVNRLRAAVLERCRAIANQEQGVFSLTVPTGGGKTFASLSFALEHARAHGLARVIVVAPFLTIIDQTVAAYRAALGEAEDQPVLIEQHSGLDPDAETARNRLATENWDAPLVVTTAVQFFESLFAHRTSRCRKLHNLARSVIVIDEAQTLPARFLIPILEVLQELVDHYGVSIVLSTATQPLLSTRDTPDGRTIRGFRQVREIVGDEGEVRAMFRVLRRVRPERVQTNDWDEIAALIAAESRALAIVHLRNDAHELAEKVRRLCPDDPVYHLSALMCAAHRRERLSEIRRTLSRDVTSIRVISTQLVEAGVDLDFPVVFRAMAGLDALIQSAGRCNREGRLGQAGGRLVIFNAPTKPPVGILRQAADFAEAQFNGDPSLLERLFDPDTFPRFYGGLGHIQDSGIQALREKLAFEEVAKQFQLIDDGWRASIVVPFGDEPRHLLDEVEHTDNPRYLRKLARKLQPYTVEVSKKQAYNWARTGVLCDVGDLFRTLARPYEYLYDAEYGLTIPKDIPGADPAELIG